MALILWSMAGATPDAMVRAKHDLCSGTLTPKKGVIQGRHTSGDRLRKVESAIGCGALQFTRQPLRCLRKQLRF
jgi:hypothetical protein